MRKLSSFLVAVLVTASLSTSVFAAGGDNWGDDIFPPITTENATTTQKPTETTTNKQNPETNVKRPGKAQIKGAKNIKGKKIAVKIKSQKGIKSYEIRYATNKKFKKAKKVSTKKLSYTIKKLKNKKKYYISVRACKVVKGKRYYGVWSKVKSVMVKK